MHFPDHDTMMLVDIDIHVDHPLKRLQRDAERVTKPISADRVNEDVGCADRSDNVLDERADGGGIGGVCDLAVNGVRKLRDQANVRRSKTLMPRAGPFVDPG